MSALRRWHRRLGLAAAVLLALLALLAISGMLLNHADAFGLASLRLHAPWVLRLYGVQPPTARTAWPVEGHWISDWDGQLALDAEPLALHAPDGLVGVLHLGGSWLLVAPGRATLATADGMPVDTLDYPEGSTVQGAALAADGSAWLATAGGTWLRADPALTALQPAPGAAPEGLRRSVPGTLPAELARRVTQRGVGPGVTAERMLLDLHSGRFLGAAGPWVMDAAALGLLLLAGTGVWMTSARAARRPLAADRY